MDIPGMIYNFLTMKFLAKSLSTILLISLAACSSNNHCKPYFQFNQVEHYYLDIDEMELLAIEQKRNKTKKEAIQLKLLIQSTPDTNLHTSILKDIKQSGFRKKVVAASKIPQLKEIFCERRHEDVWSTTCMAIYRDILIFKQTGKIIGTAKICFDCGDSVITGAVVSTTEFGQSGDFGKLYQLLH
jgi:hypothetical protein